MFVLGLDEGGPTDGLRDLPPKLEAGGMVMAPSYKLLLLFLSLPAFST